MICDFHIFVGTDRFHSECYRHDGIFFGILYTCNECNEVYFESHCDTCELRICDIGIPSPEECQCGEEE